MKNSIYILLFFVIQFNTTQSQNISIDYYLPNESFDLAVESPAEYLGWQIGDWHINHSQLVSYCKSLAKESPKVVYHEYAKSHEGRPLFYLIITSEKNHSNLENIRKNHLDFLNPSLSAKNSQGNPIIIYQGFSIHGNEPSGGNAAPLLAYRLAASKSEVVKSTLDEMIVLLDPCYNPDGFHRFSTWVNSHKSLNLNTDPNSREFSEVWPKGRTNHYWFDLNRDWLPVQHPESKGRIREFYKWRPTVLTDHHEMGTNSTFFFQPGVPSRTNPLTPPKNQELTGKIGQFHAKALDKLGSLYYSGESFDDFYYGKGSTYPDANGSIGILFEQGSSRGHKVESENGILTFPFTIRNQLTTAISTEVAALELKDELLDYQRNFFKNIKKEAKGGYVYSAKSDKQIIEPFIEMLAEHEIDIYKLKDDYKPKKGATFKKENSFYVPLDQPQFRLIKSMFYTNTEFTDSLFYDVSTWNMPMAFNLNSEFVKKAGFASKDKFYLDNRQRKRTLEKSDYGYLLLWEDYYAPKALNHILKRGLRAKVAMKPFTLEGESYQRGTVFVPIQKQVLGKDGLHQFLTKTLKEIGVRIEPVSTGLTPVGIDLGSRNFKKIRRPEVLMIVGDGVSPYGAGEVWHLMDQRFDMNVTMVDFEKFNKMDLGRYNSLILADGRYTSASSKIKKFVENGGNLITIGRATDWLVKSNLTKLRMVEKADSKLAQKRLPYQQMEGDNRKHSIGGAIVASQLDLTHPLAFGYSDENLPLWKNNTNMLEIPNNKYATPVQYKSKPLLSGYMSKENQVILGGKAALVVSKLGRGKVIAFGDNPLFRAYWYGTNKLFLNALFFGNLISNSASAEESGHGHQH